MVFTKIDLQINYKYISTYFYFTFMTMQHIYTKMLQETQHKLLESIYNDYGIKYGINMEQLTSYANEYQLKTTFTEDTHTKLKFKKKVIPDEHRCQARVWGDGYLDVKHYKKYNNNISKLNPNAFGEQCRKKRHKDDIYCTTHSNKLVHGNYYLVPSEEVIGFYVKKNSYRFS